MPDHHGILAWEENSLGEAEQKPGRNRCPSSPRSDQRSRQVDQGHDEGGEAEDPPGAVDFAQAPSGHLGTSWPFEEDLESSTTPVLTDLQKHVAVVERALDEALLLLGPAEDGVVLRVGDAAIGKGDLSHPKCI